MDMKITNSKAFHDFEIQDRFEAGINLTGAEVKAVKLGHADLTGSHVRLVGGEAYLIGASIFPYEYARPEKYDVKRTRKLLLHKAEIISLKSKTDGSSLTIVPISLYTRHKLIKAELGLGKSKKKYQKKESLKQRDIERDIQTALKNK
jgi:SsrA-binding protein